MIRRFYSLVFVRDTVNRKVLLGLKKRGFGKFKWNGLGGKVQPGESILDSAKRESKEEANVDLTHLKYVGYLEFLFENDTETILTTHVFCSDQYSGNITESEEIRPQWFNYDNIPFDNMWKDDIYWFHFMLSDKLFKGRFYFKADQETIENYELNEVEKLE
ncbi:unnamed protein product [Brachionus calyciflorus]|uniref:Oxidized purine nucleoside triphosphate hydrolase n=1 Tax=Brachionus calyciflorus TaxID=104777 RepID=A0A813N666_9BILA|nr:unnamed protein product [Brachionus calyciflorus]